MQNFMAKKQVHKVLVQISSKTKVEKIPILMLKKMDLVLLF